jgi:type IV secretory pathway TraG/TraD family ATPase VirD4
VTNFRSAHRSFGIKRDDRRRHMYVIGKTGMGKSTLLENLIVQDIRHGEGLAVVDPHGDLVEKILRFVPARRVNDVVYVNPADLEHPVAFNVLESVDPARHHLVASGLIAVFKKIWADSWGPRLEYILRNAILALLAYGQATLLGVPRMLVDREFRARVVARTSDPVVRAFWEKEFEGYAQQFRSEAVAPIQNKIGQFLSAALIRNIVGQVHSTIDLRQVMDDGQILLLNLAKGRIGEDNSALLGALFITQLQLAAMGRIDRPESTRRDFYLHVDEFQDFATDSFATILSEARKYRLCLTIAHQYITQLDEPVRDAVFGNVGTLVAFRVGAQDAKVLAEEFAPVFTEQDLVELAKYDCYLRLMIDGVASRPFSATGLPPATSPAGLEEKVIRVSRERYGRSRGQVEARLGSWFA